MNGNIKEYEPTIQTTYGEVTEEQLERLHKRDEERKAERLAAINARLQRPEQKDCPFMQRRKCSTNCALYGDGCVIADGAKAIKDTQGKRCPFTPYNCGNQCALYREGCILNNIFIER